MRTVLALACAAVLGAILWSAAPVVWGRSPRAAAIYEPNPDHLWNRLHAKIFVRDDLPDTQRLPDALDPPLWYHTQYLLSNPSHKQAVRILDEFLQTHAENLTGDPLKRAILQRDLWAVFDWAVARHPEHVRDPAYEEERRELRTRLAEVLRRIALSPEELAALPDNYAQAVSSGEFGRNYDPAHRERAFLPPDLFEAQGPWVELEDPGNPEPVAFQHFSDHSARSSFLVFLRLPGGRKAAFDYLQALWSFPGPWVLSPADANHPQVVNPDVPQFPTGTEVALVRQLTLFDNQGRLVNSPITESLQIRVYREIRKSDHPPAGLDGAIAESGQDFYDIELSRPQLFAGKAGGLRALQPGEKDFTKFGAFGPDGGRPGQYLTLDNYSPVLKQCVFCHQGAGIHSLNSRVKLLKPHVLQKDRHSESLGPHWWQDARTLSWKQSHDDWAALTAYWKASGGSH
ncbi:MAG: hypothetical protein LAO03_20405 [Acidobacteriia bacterium]|nr:hypothetical protein [Terriglobia bacterium]